MTRWTRPPQRRLSARLPRPPAAGLGLPAPRGRNGLQPSMGQQGRMRSCQSLVMQMPAPALHKTTRQEAARLQHQRSPGRSAKSGAFSIRFRWYRKALQSFVLQRGVSHPRPNLFTKRGVSSKDLNPRWQREPRGSQGGWGPWEGRFGCQQCIAKGVDPLRLGCSVTSPLASALLLAGLARATRGCLATAVHPGGDASTQRGSPGTLGEVPSYPKALLALGAALGATWAVGAQHGRGRAARPAPLCSPG